MMLCQQLRMQSLFLQQRNISLGIMVVVKYMSISLNSIQFLGISQYLLKIMHLSMNCVEVQVTKIKNMLHISSKAFNVF
jgi:hypothetical protein